MTKVVAYCRISSDSQTENTSIASQKSGIISFCNAKNLELVEIYTDVASGKDFNRTAFKAMEERLAGGDIAGVVVYKYDRLSRSPIDGRGFTDRLDKAGIAFLSVNDNIDTSSPVGKALFTMMLTFAEMERSIIHSRTLEGKKARLAAGGKCSGFVFGYRWVDRKLTPDASEAAVVRKIFKMKAKGYTNASIANWLNSSNLKTRRGGNWNGVNVKLVLANPFYAGKLRFNGKIAAGNHTPLVSKYVFETANKS